MAGTISLAFRNRLLQAYFTPDAFVGDESLFVAVTRTVALANDSGLNLTEPDAAAYARPQIDLTSNWWALSGAGEMYNTTDIDFAPPDAGDDWGYLSGWALLDAPDSGVVLAVGSLIQPLVFTSDLPYLSISPQGVTVGLYD